MIINTLQWNDTEPPTEAAIKRIFEAEGLQPYRWSNAPGDVYSAHVHSAHKLLYVLSGSITFGLPHTGQSLVLYPGDRLDLPPGVVHDALVGPQGVVCLEAYRD
jgi:quercetin dioxygenase-like cupin family protein